MTIDIRFKYDGYWRQVSNVTFEWDTKTIIGFEMRKNGRFVYRPKRYSMDKIKDMTYVKPFLRNGPKVSIP